MLFKVRGHLFKGGFDRLELTKSPFLRHWILRLIDGHIHAMMRPVGQARLICRTPVHPTASLLFGQLDLTDVPWPEVFGSLHKSHQDVRNWQISCSSFAAPFVTRSESHDEKPDTVVESFQDKRRVSRIRIALPIRDQGTNADGIRLKK